jgi:opacity protein-like surface antigen
MRMIVRLAGVVALLLAASAAQAQNKVPWERALEALVKTTLLSFNDANVTGNYSVFHAKLSKPFRDQFPVERLQRTFRDFNKKHIDFDIIAALKPTYDPPPRIDDNGKLLVKGHFPTEPLRLYFDLEFIPSDGEWKLIGINVKVDDPR